MKNSLSKAVCKPSYKQFGNKMKELIYLVQNTEGWEDYVNDDTEQYINSLLEYQNISKVMEIYDIKYITLRSKYLAALSRIKEKKTDNLRNAKSEKAKKLIELTDTIPNWQSFLAGKEIEYTESFLKLKNFYAVGRALNVEPSNVAGTIYGTNQREGVLNKLENAIKSEG